MSPESRRCSPWNTAAPPPAHRLHAGHSPLPFGLVLLALLVVAGPASAQDAILVGDTTVWADPEKTPACHVPAGTRIAVGSRSEKVYWMWNVEMRDGPHAGCRGVVGPRDFLTESEMRRQSPPPERARTLPRAQGRSALVEQPPPPDGQVRIFTSAQPLAPFELKAAPGRHSLGKLVEASSRAPAMTIFVRGGTTVSVYVPLGGYEIHFASGTTWYGYEHLFGPATRYYKAGKMFDFRDADSHIQGYSITLYDVRQGNLRIIEIGRHEF